MKKLNIIYEDRELLVVNKPAKLLCVGTDKEKERTLYHEVREYLHKKNQKVFVVHRLDKDTSGLVLFAKNQILKEKLQNNWQKYTREYIAVVEGKLPKSKDTIRVYLKDDNFGIPRVSNSGTPAITNYEVLDTNSSQSLVKINIKTGRKNQIRASLAYLGNPIVGDKKYDAHLNSLSRLGLHATRLVITHPIKNKEMEFISKAPQIFYLGFPKYKEEKVAKSKINN